MLTCWARSLSREVKRVSLYVPIRTAFNPPIHSVDGLVVDGHFKKELIAEKYKKIHIPIEERKLKHREVVPTYPHLPNIRPPKQKFMIYRLRGREEVHNTLLHKQFGVIALRGGLLKQGHMEMIRLAVHHYINVKNMFAIWRVEAPWQPKTTKPIGKRMGGGKRDIHHYVTPVKAKRVIIEVGGNCSFHEVFRMLRVIANGLPFPAAVVTQAMLENEVAIEKRRREANQNPFTFKYLIQNNMLNCHKWAKPLDHIYFGEYD